MSSSKLKPYPEYKDTGYSWIGKIPKHWEISRVKHLFRLSKERVSEDNPQILSLTQKGIVKRDISNFEGQIAATYDGYHRVNIGDIVFNPMDLRSGFVDSSPFTGIISPAYTILKPKIDVSNKFYGVWFQRHYLQYIFWPFGKGVSYEHRWTLSDETLLNFPILKPPLNEQKRISETLEKIIQQTSHLVNQLLEKIKLLEEKRAVMITEIVTKGLNPHVLMKDSGISWLGEIPSHWSVSKVGYLSKIISKGTTPSTLNREFVPKGIKFLKAENIHYDGSVSALPDFYIDNETDNLLKRSRLMSNDILMVIAGATTGKCAVLNSDFIPANTNQAVCFIRLKDTRISKFVQAWLSSELIQEQIKQDSVQSAQPNLAMEEIRKFVCPLPSIDEIEHITNRIMEFNDAISNSKSIIEKQINHLIEYRRSIISAAVTGKIDVRSL